MLSVKLVRSLVLGETMATTHESDENIKKKKMAMLLFIPTRELISDTFRLATIARHLGMDFHPSYSLSHLFFSWPPPLTPSSFLSLSTHHHHHRNRNSVSSQTSTFTQTSSSSTNTSSHLVNDVVPIPFPSITIHTSISLLRSFVSISKGFFKLVFLNPTPNSDPGFFNWDNRLVDYDSPVELSLFSRVSGKRVKSIDDLSIELAGKGWSLFRSPVKKKSGSGSGSLLLEDSVYLYRKVESNRVRVGADGGGGECRRVRELRLPALDFEKAVNLRVLLYILLMTDDVFYLN